jgi:hypothetical protein
LCSLEIFLPELVLVGIIAPVQRCPLGLILEQAHSLCVLQTIVSVQSKYFPSLAVMCYSRDNKRGVAYVLLISGKAMVNATGQDDQVALLEPDPDPVIGLTPDIEETRAIENVPDLFVLVQVFMEEALHLLFVNISHLFGRDGDLIPVLVVARCS